MSPPLPLILSFFSLSVLLATLSCGPKSACHHPHTRPGVLCSRVLPWPLCLSPVSVPPPWAACHLLPPLPRGPPSPGSVCGALLLAAVCSACFWISVFGGSVPRRSVKGHILSKPFLGRNGPPRGPSVNHSVLQSSSGLWPRLTSLLTRFPALSASKARKYRKTPERMRTKRHSRKGSSASGEIAGTNARIHTLGEAARQLVTSLTLGLALLGAFSLHALAGVGGQTLPSARLRSAEELLDSGNSGNSCRHGNSALSRWIPALLLPSDRIVVVLMLLSDWMPRNLDFSSS